MDVPDLLLQTVQPAILTPMGGRISPATIAGYVRAFHRRRKNADYTNPVCGL
jgi:hypothetical protein